MPDDFPANPGLENWSRNQLTYHFKELRKLYHTKGKIGELTFEGVFGDDEDTQGFLDDPGFTNDHVKVSGMQNAERYAHTYRTFALQTWNNLRSPANPRNYFHGKLLPTRLDDKGNLVFKYCPSSYEERWKKEGIDLTA